MLLFAISTFACTCVRDTITMHGSKGQVFAVTERRPGYREPLPNAVIKLIKVRKGKEKIIAEVAADNMGRFAFDNIKPGNYVLSVSEPRFQTLVTRLILAPEPTRANENLIVGLDPTLDCCVGWVKTEV